MMRRLLLLCALLLPGSLLAQSRLPWGIPASKSVSFRIWLPSGTVRVQTWDRDSISVTGTIGKGSHFFGGGGTTSAKIGIEPDVAGDTRLARADLVVTVPRKARLWIKMTDGDVSAVGTTGELEIITVAGTIDVSEADGVVSVETIDAMVQLRNIKGDLRARSGSGAVLLNWIQATMTVGTVSGAIDLSGSNIQDADLSTIGGAITVRGSISPKAMLDVGTHSGNISLFLPTNALPALTLTSRSGKVKNPFGAGTTSAGKVVAHSFKGDLNVFAFPDISKRKPFMPP